MALAGSAGIRLTTNEADAGFAGAVVIDVAGLSGTTRRTQSTRIARDTNA
jgi:hypothetical protein